jgi:subtilisin family serine protease
MRVSLVVACVVASLLLAPNAATSATVAINNQSAALTATPQNYIVLYKGSAITQGARNAIVQAGGTLVYAYDQIGVAIVSSANASFREYLLLLDKSVENASATERFAVQLNDATDAEGPPSGDLTNSPATDADSLSGLQWDMRQIKSPEAHAITGGSPSVLVGDIDTGLDYRHPDLRANVDDANSVNCVSGAPVPGMVAANDDNGHGTHTAGTIAAASNGIGIVGVAPNVKIAGVKAGNAAGYFFPEAIICAFMWVGTHHFDVTNNSYFADPYLFNCRNDPVQHAIWKAEQRAIRFALQEGVTVVAAEGNESEDLAHPTVDATSPDDSTPVVRSVTNACVVIPVEISGVIGVTATGDLRRKSFYSNFGVGLTQVAAPGGDSRQLTAAAPNGRVLSTYPPNQPCARSVQETGDVQEPTTVYCYLQGTSMASPHVAGLAALVISRYGDGKTPQNGKLRPAQVQAIIAQTADPQPCPTDLTPYATSPGTESGAPQSCQGGTGYNSWYGNGIVNALSAVTHAP